VAAVAPNTLAELRKRCRGIMLRIDVSAATGSSHRRKTLLQVRGPRPQSARSAEPWFQAAQHYLAEADGIESSLTEAPANGSC
jgi:hypothetical protein